MFDPMNPAPPVTRNIQCDTFPGLLCLRATGRATLLLERVPQTVGQEEALNAGSAQIAHATAGGSWPTRRQAGD